MILYYSATGNTKFIATELAKKLDDQCTDLLGRIRKSDFSELHSDKPYIVCAPVYMSEMPRFISEYIKNTSFTGNRAVYFIADNAGYAGITSWQAKKLFKKKNMEFMGCAEPVMPNNYYISHYKPSTDEEIKERLFKAFDKIDEIANSIQNCEKLKTRHVLLIEKLITFPVNSYTYKKISTKDFKASDKCIGCGKCEEVCPLNNITIKEDKPAWGANCSHCMGCIGNCPTSAIEYGEITREKGKYNFEEYRHFLNEIR